ncbi:M56 family metallopeptidase [Aestuariibaculum suncheonense]|uniref:TonB-dependent receptor plug domain-containing protein n=1 Tax=Aestuariibaculum suncheonense TaxID=1028745 RepID=A0A8J6UJK3_9FLAO|nr:M56 family metallopeptidase [Aestuariibaculum suncheonense]MBD0834856.1 TonB-dependent receptor plug domain-containing protein [Aestuariibaculum suncheonense]
MEYLIKSTAIIAIFYTFYKLILQRETFFQVNRWFLFLGLIFALVGPFIIIPNYIEYTAPQITESTSEFSSNDKIKTSLAEQNFQKENTHPIPKQNPTPIQNSNLTEPVQDSFISNISLHLWDYILMVYVLGGLYFTIRFSVRLSSVFRVIKTHKSVKAGPYKVIRLTNDAAPFSFFKWIIYNPNQFNETEIRQVITHEKVHANQMHSIDILLSEIISIAFWFNPLIWLYNKAIKQNLEYIADSVAQHKSESNKSYQYTLLKTCVPSHQMALTNTFYNSLIKKRILMLQKSKSKNINLIKYVLIIPMLLLFLISCNSKTIYVENSKTQAYDVTQLSNYRTRYISDYNTKEDLNNIINDLKNYGVTLKIDNVERNDYEQITQIDVTANYKGQVHSLRAGNGLDLISSIRVGLDDSNKLLVSNMQEDILTSITKNTTESDLIAFKNILSNKGVDFQFKDLEYNTKNELTNITISLKNDTSHSTGTFCNHGYPIFPMQIKTARDHTGIYPYASINNYELMFNKQLFIAPLIIPSTPIHFYNQKLKLSKLGIDINYSNLISDNFSQLSQITVNLKNNISNLTETFGNGTYTLPGILFGQRKNNELFAIQYLTERLASPNPNSRKSDVHPLLLISKFSQQKDLEAISNYFKARGFSMSYSDVAYNDKNELTAITTTFKAGDYSHKQIWSNNGFPICPISFEDHDNHFLLYQFLDPFEAKISKNTTDKEFEQFINQAKIVGTTLEFKNIKRNKNNEITAIEASFKNNRNSNTLIIDTETPITPFSYAQYQYRSDWQITIENLKLISYDFKHTAIDLSNNKSLILINGKPNDTNKTKLSYPVEAFKSLAIKYGVIELTIDESLERDHSNFVTTDALFILNGKIVSYENYTESNNSDEFRTSFYNSLNPEEAIEQYGEKAKYGAVERFTKKMNPRSESRSIVINQQPPIYILDGKEMPSDKLSNISPENIESINVLKDKAAIDKYGEKAKNGVVEITSKK